MHIVFIIIHFFPSLSKVAMEVLRHVETDVVTYSKEIEKLYSTWMGKIHSWKNKPLKV